MVLVMIIRYVNFIVYGCIILFMGENLTELEKEFKEVLVDVDEEGVSLDYLVENTSVKDRKSAKEVLRKMIDREMITTTPGFKYKM